MTRKHVDKGAASKGYPIDLAIENGDTEVDTMPDFNSESETSDAITTGTQPSRYPSQYDEETR